MKRSKRWLSFGLALTLMGVSAPSVYAGPGGSVDAWLTTADQTSLLAKQAPLHFSADGDSNPTTIDIRPGLTYQTMDDFGAAITGSSAYLMNKKMSPGQREALLNDLFTNKGINIGFVRHTIGASDFSVDGSGNANSYTYDDVASGTDYGLKHFSIAKDADVTSVLRAIVRKKPGLKVLGSPWTAPPWMKTGTPTFNGGSLNGSDPKVYAAYADYFVKYINAYKNAGIPIWGITVQNEPEHSTANYPSMSMGAAEQASFIKNDLGPAFQRSGLSTKIIAFDHNWDIGVNYASTILGDSGASAYTDGTAYHCYGGSPSAMTTVHDAFPSKNIYFTECSGGEWSTDFGNNLSWNMSNLLIGSPRNWAKAVLLWNMALDPKGGPINGGCTNCRGVVTIDPNNGNVTKNVEYYVIGHASKFVAPGAVRIDSTNFAGSIENVAYRNPDGSLVLIAANVGADSKTFKVRMNSQSFIYTLPAKSAVTFKWKPSPGRDGRSHLDSGTPAGVAESGEEIE
ncbi:glycoside hydrolase family 30 protein [Paenibacillus tyrfis]|uniref:glycoside hydrolase family 30 protein n=1 Tax=Paenibacillus tyrfis TaxID=1501230 RepID=UPI0035CD02C0